MCQSSHFRLLGSIILSGSHCAARAMWQRWPVSDELCPREAEHPSPRKAHLSFCRLHKQCHCCLGLSCRTRSMLYKRRPPRWWVWARRLRNKLTAVKLSRLAGCSLLRQNQAYPDTDSLRPGCLCLDSRQPRASPVLGIPSALSMLLLLSLLWVWTSAFTSRTWILATLKIRRLIGAAWL